VPQRRYEFRITGKLSQHTRSAFPGMDIAEVPAETVISGDVNDNRDVQQILTTIQSLGLQLVSLRRAPRRTAVHRPG
jgi:hypothetical protein